MFCQFIVSYLLATVRPEREIAPLPGLLMHEDLDIDLRVAVTDGNGKNTGGRHTSGAQPTLPLMSIEQDTHGSLVKRNTRHAINKSMEEDQWANHIPMDNLTMVKEQGRLDAEKFPSTSQARLTDKVIRDLLVSFAIHDGLAKRASEHTDEGSDTYSEAFIAVVNMIPPSMHQKSFFIYALDHAGERKPTRDHWITGFKETHDGNYWQTSSYFPLDLGWHHGVGMWSVGFNQIAKVADDSSCCELLPLEKMLENGFENYDAKRVRTKPGNSSAPSYVKPRPTRPRTDALRVKFGGWASGVIWNAGYLDFKIDAENIDGAKSETMTKYTFDLDKRRCVEDCQQFSLNMSQDLHCTHDVATCQLTFLSRVYSAPTSAVRFNPITIDAFGKLLDEPDWNGFVRDRVLENGAIVKVILKPDEHKDFKKLKQIMDEENVTAGGSLLLQESHAKGLKDKRLQSGWRVFSDGTNFIREGVSLEVGRNFKEEHKPLIKSVLEKAAKRTLDAGAITATDTVGRFAGSSIADIAIAAENKIYMMQQELQLQNVDIIVDGDFFKHESFTAAAVLTAARIGRKLASNTSRNATTEHDVPYIRLIRRDTAHIKFVTYDSMQESCWLNLTKFLNSEFEENNSATSPKFTMHLQESGLLCVKETWPSIGRTVYSFCLELNAAELNHGPHMQEFMSMASHGEGRRKDFAKAVDEVQDGLVTMCLADYFFSLGLLHAGFPQMSRFELQLGPAIMNTLHSMVQMNGQVVQALLQDARLKGYKIDALDRSQHRRNLVAFLELYLEWVEWKAA